MDKCKNCNGQGWVCEAHPNVPWGDGVNCCGAAGEPCKVCNPSKGRDDPPRMPPGTTIWDREHGYRH